MESSADITDTNKALFTIEHHSPEAKSVCVCVCVCVCLEKHEDLTTSHLNSTRCEPGNLQPQWSEGCPQGTLGTCPKSKYFLSNVRVIVFLALCGYKYSNRVSKYCYFGNFISVYQV